MSSLTSASFTSAKSALFGLLSAAILVAQPVYSATKQDLTKLEQAFWGCDYVATIHGAANVDGVKCASITDELKRVKFEGDFEKLLAWWRANKPTQHAALDRAEMALAAGESAETVEYPDSI